MYRDFSTDAVLEDHEKKKSLLWFWFLAACSDHPKPVLCPCAKHVRKTCARLGPISLDSYISVLVQLHMTFPLKSSPACAATSFASLELACLRSDDFLRLAQAIMYNSHAGAISWVLPPAVLKQEFKSLKCHTFHGAFLHSHMFDSNYIQTKRTAAGK